MPPKKKARNNGKRYSDTEKIVACQILRAAGGVLTEDLLQQIRTALKLPSLSWDSVQRWYNLSIERPLRQTSTAESREQNATPVESSALDFEKAAAREIVEHTFRQYAKHANVPTVVEATEGRQAAQTMADMLKLMQLLDGMPTEIVGWSDELLQLAGFFREANIEGSLAIREWRLKLEARRKAAQEQAVND